MSGSLSCHMHRDAGGFAALAGHWDRLLAATPDANPWQARDWLEGWWRRMSGPRRLHLLEVRRDGEPCLLLPLQCSTERMAGLSLRVLEPVGMPDDIHRPALALGAPDREAFDTALRSLLTNPPDWQVLRLDEKTADDRELAWLQALATDHGLALRSTPLHPCPWLDLRQDWPQYLASRGRRLARNLRAARRRLELVGPVTLRVASEPDAVAAAFETFLAIHAASWKHGAGLGLGRSEVFRDSYRAFLAGRAARDEARVLLLESGGKAVAGCVAVISGQTWYAAQIAHDAAFDAASPGTLLEALELEYLMTRKLCTRYEFFGGALNNKLRWTDEAPETLRVLLFRPGLTPAVAQAWYFGLKPRLQRLRRRG